MSETTGARGFQRVRGIVSDFALYFLRRPRIPTLVRFAADADRIDYQQRILQRLGARVDRFTILNIHRIGIDVPPLLVWERLRRWGMESSCWPACIAPMEHSSPSDELLEVFLFGRKEPWPGLGTGLFGFDLLPLLRMKLERRQDTPGALAPDSGRFVLYRCVGSYPIGLFSIYVRTPIPSEGERERTQFFFGVAFDFYGRPQWSRMGPVRWTWERIHNRVTGNVLNRFKWECECEFARHQMLQ